RPQTDHARRLQGARNRRALSPDREDDGGSSRRRKRTGSLPSLRDRRSTRARRSAGRQQRPPRVVQGRERLLRAQVVAHDGEDVRHDSPVARERREEHERERAARAPRMAASLSRACARRYQSRRRGHRHHGHGLEDARPELGRLFEASRELHLDPHGSLARADEQEGLRGGREVRAAALRAVQIRPELRGQPRHHLSQPSRASSERGRLERSARRAPRVRPTLAEREVLRRRSFGSREPALVLMRDENLVRWRLILGAEGEALDSAAGMTGEDMAADSALGWLYDRAEEGSGEAEREIRERGSGPGASTMSVPKWLDQVHKLFPRETIERLERDAVEKYNIHEVVTSPEVLQRIEPSETLLRAVLHTKHLMNPEVLAM